MNIVTPYARICGLHQLEAPFDVLDGLMLLRRIEFCGRISHRSEDKQTEDSWRRFIQANVLEHGDWSIVEHASVTVEATMDRGISHEWVRHRLFSFTQSSTRFINHVKKMPPEFVRPPLPESLNTGDEAEMAFDAWECAMHQAEDSYRVMIERGIAPQIARSVLPNSLATKIMTTGNLRNWRHLMIMRTTKESHPQMREITIPLLAEFKAAIPLIFDDLEPLAKQSDNLKKPR